MGSRIREKTKHVFEVFVEIAKPNGKDEAPFIIQQYPPDYDDKETLMMIPRFAYPCPTDASQVDHFTFVLTDLDSMFRFGHCRHATGHQTCLCIVSWLPWYEIFYKMLDLLAEITNRSENNQVTTFLKATYAQDVPLPRIPVTIIADQDMFSFTAPDPNSLPKIPGSRNLTEYYNAVDPNSMMLIFASMLHERRIYMTSKKLSRLTACIHAAEALLYPMHWQHLYIPVLPAHLIDYVSAPMPFLIGVHSNLVEKLKLNRVDVGDAVVVDLDYNTVTSEYDDLGDLPEDVCICVPEEDLWLQCRLSCPVRLNRTSSYLRRNLKTDVIKNSVMKMGDAISMAFLNALVRLIGGYRDALKFRPGEPITFDPESFVHSRPSQSTQAFLEGMLTLQIFQQFIYGRLEMLNAGDGFKDIFEQQATLFADKLNSQSTYKEWLKSVKKSGKKGWNGLKVKAAPVMSTAVHSVKEQGKRAIADFKTKLSGLTENEDKKWSAAHVSGGVLHTKPHRPRPITAPAGTLPRAQRQSSHNSTSSEHERRNRTSVRTRSIEETHDDSQLRLSYHTIDMNLMTDLDIQTTMMRSASAEILSSQTEQDSSADSDSESGSSDSNATDTNIAFDTLRSSDEDLNFVPPSTDRTVQKEGGVEIAGDKLIFTRPRPEVSGDPIAKPRKKKAVSHDGPSPVPHNWNTLNAETSKLDQRRYNKKDEHTETPYKTVQDAPLIKFDSSESEPTDFDNFDPLRSVSSAEPFGRPVSVESLGHGSEANAGSRVSHSKLGSDTANQQTAKTFSAKEIFDPLSDLAGISVSSTAQVPKPQTYGGTGHSVRSDPLSSHSPRRDSADLLMHEWSLASLSRGHNISLPRATQPLKMRYPNNPFVLGSSPNQSLVNPSSFSSAQLRAGGLHNQGSMLGHNQTQQLGLFLGQKVSEFHKVNQLGSRQPIRGSNSSLPAPRQLSTASYAPYSLPRTPMTPQTHGTVSSASNKLTHASPPAHVQSSSSVGPSSSTSGTSSQKSDFFTDLLDIDFGGKTSQTTSLEPQQHENSTVSTPRTSQSAWETFD